MTPSAFAALAALGAIALIAIGFLACGPATTRSSAAPAAADGGGELDSWERVATLDVIAARGATEAPLMRESMRVADARRPIELRAERDECFRAIVAASRPVRAWFEDVGHAPRGDAAALAVSPTVPPRGPACARKGEVLRLVVELAEPATVARAVVWQSP